jgi:hypothetical protein
VFEAPGAGGDDFIQNAFFTVAEREDGFKRNFQPIENGNTYFIIVGPKPHFDGGHLLGFEDTEEVGAS